MDTELLRTITYMQTFNNWMLRINLKHPPASHELQSRCFTYMLGFHQPERGEINANNGIRKEMVMKLNCRSKQTPCRTRTGHDVLHIKDASKFTTMKSSITHSISFTFPYWLTNQISQIQEHMGKNSND